MWGWRLYRGCTRAIEALGIGWGLNHIRITRAQKRAKDAAVSLRPSCLEGKDVLWVHAASLGEGLSVKPLVERALRQENMHILMTFSSGSGVAGMPRLLSVREEKVSFSLLPLDLPGEMQRFVTSWRPVGALWVESELWPNALWELRQRNIPATLVQGRLSARSMHRWSLFGWSLEMLQWLLGTFTRVVAKTEKDRERIALVLGETMPMDVADLKRVGDTATSPPPEWAKSLRPRALLAASTHSGEEEVILEAHIALCKSMPWVTIVAPRHPERCAALYKEISAKVSESGVLLLSELENNIALPEDWESGPRVILVDSLGVLRRLYGYVDVAFVGGSLRESGLHGSHNVYEPLHHGCGLVLQGDAAVPCDGAEFVRKVARWQDIVKAVQVEPRIYDVVNDTVLADHVWEQVAYALRQSVVKVA